MSEQSMVELMFETVWEKVKDEVLTTAERGVKDARDMSNDLPPEGRQSFLNQVDDICNRYIERVKMNLRSYCERYCSDEQFRERVISLYKAQN